MAHIIFPHNQYHKHHGEHSYTYHAIERGASLTIPVWIKTPFDEPIDLTDTEIIFTVKKVHADFDRYDDFAYIKKNFLPQEPEQGRFFILLSSADTDFEIGDFFFDIEIIKPSTGMVYRIATFSFKLVGGVSNRMINSDVGQMPLGEEIKIIQTDNGHPIVVIAPMLAFAPDVYNRMARMERKVDDMRNEINTLTYQNQLIIERLEAAGI